jgi:hypothetical protein
MGFWSKLGKIGLGVGAGAGALFTGGASLAALPGILGAAGAGLGAAAQGSASNRGEKFGGQMDLERLLLEREQQGQQLAIGREQEGRAGSSDAWRKLLAAQHTLSPGARPQLAGQYSVAPRMATDDERTGADALTREVMARLQGGNPIPRIAPRPLEVDRNLLNAGGFEKFAGIASPFLSMLSKFKRQGDPEQDENGGIH